MKLMVAVITVMILVLIGVANAAIFIRQPDGSYVQLDYSNINTANIYVSGSKISLDEIFTGVSTVKVKDTNYVNLDIWHVKGEHVKFQTTTTPTDYAQYRINISGTTWSIYNVTGAFEASGTITDFWSKVSTTGSDIRVFDQNGNLMYFWIEEFDYTNQNAVIWVNLTAGSSELNIAYGNSLATESNYEDGEQVFIAFDDYENDLSNWEFTNSAAWSRSTSAAAEGTYGLEHDGNDKWARHVQAINLDKVVVETFASKNEASNAVGIMLYANWDNKDGYEFSIHDNGIRIAKQTGGSDTNLVSKSESIAHYTFYKLVFIKDGNTLIGKFYDADGSLIDEISATDSTYATIQNAGFVTYYIASYFDAFKVIKLADPADFGTPQLVTR